MATTKQTNELLEIPMLAMRGLVLFPNQVMHFDVGRKKSILAIKAAMEADRKIFLVSQSDISKDDPEVNDLYKTGVVANIKQLLKAEKDSIRILVEGEYKAKIKEVIQDRPYFMVNITKARTISQAKIDETEKEARIRLLKSTYEKYVKALPNSPKEMLTQVFSEKQAEKIYTAIIANILISPQEKQALLQKSQLYVAIEQLTAILQREVSILELEQEIFHKVRFQMDKNQRDYFLREQVKAIQAELNDFDSPEDETYYYFEQVLAIKNIDEDSREKLLKECERLERTSQSSQEYNVIRNYLDLCISLPFDKSTKDSFDIEKAQKQLNKDHYGLEKVKERILELLSVRKLAPDIKGQIICLVGPPGVGKTSIASSIAKTLKRKYSRVSLGGVRDEAEIRGHRKTYIGAMPGRIITAIKQAKSNNPLILLDEIDKMGSDHRGDPSSAMLEVLDSAQNNAFVDHYVEIPFDLSDVLFITTANTTQTIPQPLLDRMEVIEVSSYTREEKFNIAKNHLIKKQVKKHGLNGRMITFNNAAIYEIIDGYTKEAGVRKLEREIASICRKVAKIIVSEQAKKVIVKLDNLEQLLSPRKYKKSIINSTNRVGVVNGLAWTSVGGEMLEIEVAVMAGTGKIKLTGSLGAVMKESAELAISYVRTIADKYNISKEFYKNCDVHIHAPEGAVPKDGPSAGITMVTALVSALTGIPVLGNVAMTGEVSLTGRVMPIGGLKEKAMAAYREEKTIVVIPSENTPDMHEIDQVIKDAIRFIPVSNVSEVLDIALDASNKDKPQDYMPNWCQQTPIIEQSPVLCKEKTDELQ